MKTQSTGLRILITGAAGGAGLQCARAFAGHGGELILSDNDGVGLNRVSDELSAFSRYCDVASQASVAIFAAQIEEIFPSFDVLINTAGSGYVRTLGMMRMSHALLPLLRRASGNRFIFNIKPSANIWPSETLFPYASSHTGFERLSEALAEQTKGNNIYVATMTSTFGLNPLRGAFARSVAENSTDKTDDEIDLAQRILALVKAKRPEWRRMSIRRNRSA